MVQNPPTDYPRVIPYLYYRDVEGALNFLTSAFGFREKVRMPGADGTLNHAEIEMGDGVVMFGNPGPDYQGPKDGQRTHLIYVYVEDVDKHFEQARGRGATIVKELTNEFYGDRTYVAEDPEGHQWNFAQHVRDVTPEEMRAASAATAQPA
jgi:PhnB protein